MVGGKPLTGADVAFSIKLLQKTPSLDSNGVGLAVASVKVKGSTITFKYKKPNAVLYKQLADTYIVPKHQWASHIKDAINFTNYPNPVVSGPYKLVSYDTTRDVLKPNGKFFDKKKIRVSEIDCRPQQAGATQISELQAGKWDWDLTGDFTPGGFKTDFVDKNPKINHFWIKPVGTVPIYLNNAKAPFNDLAVVPESVIPSGPPWRLVLPSNPAPRRKPDETAR